MIDTILTDIIDRQSTSNRVGCFLSAGADSLSLAFSAHRLDKKLSCYSFYVDGKETSDSIGARIAAEHFGWDFTAIDVPVDNLKEDFFTLVNNYHCIKKTQVECTFPFLHMMPYIQEDEVLSGVAADGWWGSSKKCHMHFSDTKELFDGFINKYFASDNPAGVRQLEQLTEERGIKLIAPYLEDKMRDWAMQYDHKYMCKKKPLYDTFPEFRELKMRGHENLQLIAGIPDYFENLLQDPEINPYRRTRIMDVVRDWKDSAGQNDLIEFIT